MGFLFLERIMALKTIFNVSEEKTAKLAVLIDADNASAKDIENILNELTKYGEATVKRIYGNFVSQNGNWKQAINFSNQTNATICLYNRQKCD